MEREKPALHTFDWDGRERLYDLYIPESVKGKTGVPLVMVLHGARGNAAYARRMSEMNDHADRHGFLVVYPNGTGIYQHAILTWNAGNCCGYALKHNVDDLGFLSHLLEKLMENYSIPPSQVAVTGMSNGAMMAQRLACHHSDKMKVIAPVSGALNDLSKIPEHPISVIGFHGTADQHAPYSGGEGDETMFPRKDQSANDTLQFWVKVNQCKEGPVVDVWDDIEKTSYRKGKKNAEVHLYSVIDQGHAWPGGDPAIHHTLLDPPTRTISATELMVEFFRRKWEE